MKRVCAFFLVEYDPEKIFTFVGFNEHPPKGIMDVRLFIAYFLAYLIKKYNLIFSKESEKYGVRRYGSDMSRERFLGTLKLHKRVIYFFV